MKFVLNKFFTRRNKKMASTTQIVPKYSFPYVETHMNDYTIVTDDAIPAEADTSIKQAYAVVSAKGIDNVWVRKTSRAAAVKTYGESNFKKYGQPLMQALNVLDASDDASVWFCRVMPENANYANAIVSGFWRADTSTDIVDAHKRKFRIKHTKTSEESITTKEDLAIAAKKTDYTTPDAEGYDQVPFMLIRYNGRGTCGNYYSMRLSQAATYENEYGIKMYNFEALDSSTTLTKDANYVGCLVTSVKYESESTTLIDDVLGEAPVGVAPIDVVSLEDNVELIYDKYIEFLKQLHLDCIEEYEEKVNLYDIPEDQLNGTVAVEPEFKDMYDEIQDIIAMIEATDDSQLPDLDEFDLIFGRKVSTTQSKNIEYLPAIYFPKKLTPDVDTTAEDYDPYDWTTSDIIDFSSIKGVILDGGSNGYFDDPRQIVDEETGETIQWTVQDEINEAYKLAFSGVLDKKILSSRRMEVTALFDANYDYEVKMVIADLFATRDACRVYFDTGIVESVSTSIINSLISQYNFLDSFMFSTDIWSYLMKEASTNKKCRVTGTYFLATNFTSHVLNNGYQIPFVRDNCQLTGHVKDSVLPIVEEYNADVKEKLYNNRLNYVETISENVFQRSVQNTTQKIESDLLEESNALVYYYIKNQIERDANGQIYNFAEEAVRNTFIETEKAKYSSYNGSVVESIDFSFATTQYEFEHSILHLYVAIVFRGLTKRVIIEIDINKRTYTGNEAGGSQFSDENF